MLKRVELAEFTQNANTNINYSSGLKIDSTAKPGRTSKYKVIVDDDRQEKAIITQSH